MLYKNFMKLDLSKSHFGISSERQLHQHNAILSIQEFIIMRTNPLTDHCAKQREAHTSFSCYWPLLKSPLLLFSFIPMIAKCLHSRFYPSAQLGSTSVGKQLLLSWVFSPTILCSHQTFLTIMLFIMDLLKALVICLSSS